MDLYHLFLHLVKFVVLALAAYGNLSAGTIDPHTPDSRYVEFGKKFPFVRRIRTRVVLADKDPPVTVIWSASAVLIRPHWMLTAAHVVDGTTGSSIVPDDKDAPECPLTYMLVHPEFVHDTHGHFDLALGYSPRDFGLEFYPELYTDSDELDKPVTLAGFGVHGTFVTGGKHYDNQRRAGSNKISGVERSILVCDPSKENKTALEFIITPGDSGGGLFIGNKLAGIHSFLMAVDKKPDGTYTDECAHTRISLYAAWIDAEIRKYEDARRVEIAK